MLSVWSSVLQIERQKENKMAAGNLTLKNGKYYAVLNYKNAEKQLIFFPENRKSCRLCSLGKNKKPVIGMITGFFGPSDWSRTSGLLNPIQALYQTEPHPEK